MRSLDLSDSTHYLMKYIQLPLWQRWFIGLGLTCLPSFILFYVAISPTIAQQTILQQEYHSLTHQLQQLTQRNDNEPDINELTKHIEMLEQQRSAKSQPIIQQDYFNKVITHYLNQSNSQLILLKRLAPEQNEFFTTQKWQLKLLGNYTQLFQFMALLIESDHLLAIEQFMLEKDNEQLNLSFIIHLHYAMQYHHE